MQWTLVHSSLTNVYPNRDNDVLITGGLTGKYLVVLCESLGNPGWYRAGSLRSEWDDAVIGRVVDRWWGCRFGHTSIRLNDWQFVNPLVFKPKPWLVTIQIKVWSTPDYEIYDQQDRVEQKINELLDK